MGCSLTRAPQRTGDPLRPSAGGAKPRRRDLWRPMSHDVAYAGAPLLPSPRYERASPCDKTRMHLASRQTALRNRLFKAATRRTQSAFRRFDVHPCRWTEPVRDHCSFSRSELRTLSRDLACPPCLRKSRRASLPCAALARLTAHVDLAGKMLLTDFCNRPSIRALVVRPTPELLACAMTTASMMNSRALAPALFRCAASRPPCDNLNPRWINVWRRLSSFGRFARILTSLSRFETSPARRQRFRCAAFSTARRSDDPTSDALVVPRFRSALRLSDFERPESALLPSRQRGQLP